MNPISGFYFPLFSRVLPWGISIRVETCGSERKQKCGKLWSTYVQSFLCFDDSLHFHEDAENPIRSSLRQASADFRQCRPDRPRLGIQRRSCQRARQRHRYPARGALEAQTLDRRYGDLPDARDDHLRPLTNSSQPRSAGDRLVADWQHVESGTVKLVRAFVARNYPAH